MSVKRVNLKIGESTHAKWLATAEREGLTLTKALVKAMELLSGESVLVGGEVYAPTSGDMERAAAVRAVTEKHVPDTPGAKHREFRSFTKEQQLGKKK